jgi:hypothetical protein
MSGHTRAARIPLGKPLEIPGMRFEFLRFVDSNQQKLCIPTCQRSCASVNELGRICRTGGYLTQAAAPRTGENPSAMLLFAEDFHGFDARRTDRRQ